MVVGAAISSKLVFLSDQNNFVEFRDLKCLKLIWTCKHQIWYCDVLFRKGVEIFERLLVALRKQKDQPSLNDKA